MGAIHEEAPVAALCVLAAVGHVVVVGGFALLPGVLVPAAEREPVVEVLLHLGAGGAALVGSQVRQYGELLG